MRQKQFLLAFLAMLLCFAAPSFAQVAEVDGTPYTTLAEAIKNASAGQTITLLGDVTDNVTISKSLTIDGANFKYTGTMSLDGNNEVTIQNLDFVNGNIDGNRSALNRKLTVKNCDFDGVNKTKGYAITQRHGEELVIENCSATNYSTGMLYIPQNVQKITVKDVTVSKVAAAFNISYSGDGLFENVELTDVTYGLHVQNHGARTFTMKNWNSNGGYLTYVQTKATATVKFLFEGNNNAGEGQLHNSTYAKYLMNTGATLTAPEVQNMTAADFENNEVIYNEGKYTCKEKPNGVVMIGEQGYETLADALAAATAGQTITFVADITDDVTISKVVTIDGAGKTYTGAMTLKADATIKNLNFDGKGFNGYAITTRGAQYLTIEDCTAKNYGYGFVQLASGTALTTVKNVTVSNMGYGVKVDYSNEVVLENVDITAGVAAVLNSNYGEKTITIKNSKLNILGTWKRKDTIKTNYVFQGANTIEKFIIDAAIDNFKLAADATLTAPNEITVTAADAKKYEVVYKDGKYTLIPYPVMIGEQGYETLAKALAAAKAGETITLLSDITASKIITINKAITLDGNGKKLTSTAARAINVETEGEVAISNLTINAAERAINIINKPATVELNHVTATANNNAVMIATSAGAAKVTIDGCDFTGLAVVNVAGAKSNVAIKNSKITNVDANTAENYGAITVWTSAEEAVVNVENTTITVTDDSKKAYVFPATATVNGVEGVGYIIATIGDAGFDTLTDAIAKAEAGETVTMIRDVKMSEILTVNKAITLDGNGNTLKSTAGRAINVSGVNGVTIKNLTINASGERAINVINKATNVTIEKVTATAANYTVNLAASAANAVVAIKASNLTGLNVVNVAAAGAKVTVDGTTLVCNDQNANENYAAIAVNKESKNATVIVTNSTFDIKGDSAKVSNGAEGATITIDGVVYNEKIVAVIEYEGTDNYYSFTTLADAVAAAKDRETVKLIADATGAGVVIDKDITIDFNGKTYTANEGVGSAGTQTLGLQILKDNNVTLKDGTLKSDGGNVKMLVQNYANLIVDNMKLVDATDAIQYVLSNNCGNVVVKNASEITADGAIAFDACKYANYAPPTVTIEEGVVVTGNVEVSATLNMNGRLNGNIVINGAEGIVNGAEGLNVTTNIDGRNVVYANGVYTTEEFEPEAEVNGKMYASLRKAVEAAPAGATVTLLKNVTLEGGYENDPDAGLRIEKAIKINGQENYTIDCGKFQKGIRVYNPDNDKKGSNEFYGVTIVNNNVNGRCIDTRDGNINLIITESHLKAQNGNSQPLTLGGSEPLRAVTIRTHSTIDAGKSGYAVINFVTPGRFINVAGDCQISGYAAFYVKADNTKLQLANVVVTGENVHNGDTNGFGAIVVESSNNTITLNARAKVKAVANSDQFQSAFLIMSGDNNNIVINNDAKVPAEVVLEGENAYLAMVEKNSAASTSIVKYGAEMPLAAECDNYQYLTFDEAFRAANDGSTVKLLANVALDTQKLVAQNDGYATLINVKDKAITLDLNGKTINVEAAASDLANATDGMLLSVFHADTNGQLTLADNSEAQTGAVIVNANDAKIYCLAASESQYTDKSNSGKIIVNGGTYNLDKAADSMFFSDANEVITINGGNFTLGNVGTGSNGMPWIFNTYERNERHVNVYGGTFNADINHQYWAFEVNVPNNRALRYNGEEAGTWTVVDAEAWVLEKYNANYNREVGYATLEEALAVSNNVNNTVTLANNLTRAGLVINKDIIIDFNGMTYTADKGVGSAGTQTLGLQILKDNNVTLKNGTLTSTGDNVKMLVQNYANLTVEDMNLVDATDAIKYVLSNNSGNVAVKGNTNITTNAVAFDACKYANYAIPTVTVETTGTIAGNIEVTGGNLVIKAGTFTQDVTEWCAPYTVCTDNNNGTWTVEYRWQEAVTIYDNATNFENDKEFTVGTITYNRYFGDTEWQTIYLPFAVPAANLMNEFEVAYIYNASYNKVDGAAVYYVVVDGNYTLQANYPYLIRAKEAGEKSIVVENAILMPTAVKSIDCSSVFETFTFTGNYATIEDKPFEATKRHFVMNGGAWTGFNGLNPFRVYMTIELRNGEAFPTAQSINMVKVDKNGNVDTSVEKIGVDADILGIYDLQGRRVLEPQKGEIYIINGKKVVF